MSPSPSPATAVRVFLADDSRALRQRIPGLLGTAAAIVGEGETPHACIDGILATHPDVVVLDIQLSGGQGMQVLNAVRAAQPEIAFVVFSNSATPAYRKKYLAAGAARFLDKSTEFDQLAAAVFAAGQTRPH